MVTRAIPLQLDSITCYTNSGKSKDRIAWGYHIHDHSVTYDMCGSLGQRATSFQAEIYAVTQAARSLSLRNDGNIYFLVNNLSIGQTLERHYIQMLMAQECIDALKQLAQANRVTTMVDPSYSVMSSTQLPVTWLSSVPSLISHLHYTYQK